MKHLILLATLAVTGLVTSCGKDKGSDPQPTRTELLTSKNWRITAYSHTVNGSSTTYDDYSTMERCLKDDTYRFAADHTLKYSTGAEKCLATQLQEYSGDWRYTANDESKILFGLTNDVANEFSIAELTSARMVLTYNSQYTQPNGSVQQEVYRVTYSAE